ncbi:MAG: GNAT family N-acetyltransferase, partial [Candidatus Eremiobacteraeota bacterium]|nr:GNAT family N-acetyltransferase [Candidatus Eremiobacteraeota bacterium]
MEEAVTNTGDGYTAVAPGKIANIQTRLQMRKRPKIRKEPPSADFSLERLRRPVDAARYRTLYERIGADYLWASRLALSDAELLAILNDPDDDVYVLRDSEDAGMLELDFRVAGECEIKVFGIVDRLIRRGVGRWLINRAFELAWQRPIERLWLHTCTFDHPRALEFYLRHGFEPYERRIEVLEDP